MVEFTCPKCGSHYLEEVIEDALVHTPIRLDDGEVRYDDPNIIDSNFVAYQCRECGYRLPSDVTNEEELIKHLEEQHEEVKG